MASGSTGVVLTREEGDVVAAVSALDRGLQSELAAVFSARGFDISLVDTPADRMKLRDWVEKEINESQGTDLPRGLAQLRGAVRRLREAMGDVTRR
jgi:hypothetical protein